MSCDRSLFFIAVSNYFMQTIKLFILSGILERWNTSYRDDFVLFQRPSVNKDMSTELVPMRNSISNDLFAPEYNYYRFQSSMSVILR